MAPSTASPAQRLYGLDAARAGAVIGMIAVHLRPQVPTADGTGFGAVLLNLPYGRASLLFMVLAGVGVALVLKPSRSKGWKRSGTLLWRAGILLLIGLALQMLDHGVSVILPTYGSMFVLALVLVRLPGPVLLASAAFFTLAGPLALVLINHVAPFERHLPQFGDDPLTILMALLVTGRYPLLSWIVPFLVGLWLGRQPLADPRFQLRLALAGCGLALAGMVMAWILIPVVLQETTPYGLNELASGAAHSQMPPWLIEGIGVACAVIGLALAAEQWLSQRAARWFWPLCAFGQLALTFYIGHLLMLAGVLRPNGWPADAGSGIGVLGVIVLLGLVLASVWRSRFTYGPAEYLLRVPRVFQTSTSALPRRKGLEFS